MKKRDLTIGILIFLFLNCFTSIILLSNQSQNNIESTALKASNIKYENATIISDGYNGTYWNNEWSQQQAIAVDNSGTIHVVWSDETEGPWNDGIWDSEIMYASNDGSGWSNITIISDDETHWNDHWSENPSIAVDNLDIVHVVWQDYSNGDYEIMHTNYTEGIGWSNPTVISGSSSGAGLPDIVIDDNGSLYVVWNGYGTGDSEIWYITYTEGLGWSIPIVISDDATQWNVGDSRGAKIDVDNTGKLHVVWYDSTEGPWSWDSEIWYTSNDGSGWLNGTLISDDYNNWNDGYSYSPSIAVDSSGNVHVVWDDETVGPWNEDMGDTEIMYANYIDGLGWSNATVISDDDTLWNDGASYWSAIAVDNLDIVHVVWEDETEGPWGGGIDHEVMLISNSGSGWSNVTIISDDDTNWNDGYSAFPDIIIDDFGYIHIIWEDGTEGIWGGEDPDAEIMYTKLIFDNVSPELDHPNDIIYEEGIIGNNINWTATDLHPDNYTIYRDDIPIDNGTWTSGIPINISVDGLPIGDYVYTIEVSDIIGNNASDSVNVLVSSPVAPSLSHPDEIEYKEGEIGNIISWYATDMHPATFTITLNGFLEGSGTWTSDTNYTFNVDGLSPGLYVYTIEVSDQLGQTSSGTVMVTVLPVSDSDSGIPFGNSWILFSIISIIGLIFYIKKKKL